ncbi:hypothetical protein [Mycoplasma parvum]|nr:hypothetical protein [Mycoplasma parvum]
MNYKYGIYSLFPLLAGGNFWYFLSPNNKNSGFLIPNIPFAGGEENI